MKLRPRALHLHLHLLQHLPLLLAMAASTVASVAQAQFSGPPAFVSGPTSTMGTGTNALVLASTATGFTATGTYTVNITGPAAGTLASWTIDRPISSGVTNPSFQTTTSLDGFSLPPGPAITTAGLITTFVTDTAIPGTMVAGSQSWIQLGLVNGAATWTTLLNTSASFALITGTSTSYVLRQYFWLDGNINGPTGNWVVDVPAGSSLAPVPEPASALLLAAGLLALLVRRRPAGLDGVQSVQNMHRSAT